MTSHTPVVQTPSNLCTDTTAEDTKAAQPPRYIAALVEDIKTRTYIPSRVPTWKEALSTMTFLSLRNELKLSIAEGRLADEQYIRSLYKKRADPIALFSRMFATTRLFMFLMLRTQTFLVGSRAVSYFMPGMHDDDSEWDFYCMGNVQHFDQMLTYLRDALGCEGKRTFAFPYAPRDVHAYRFEACAGTVRIIHRTDNQTMPQVVNTFHSTIVSCYVSASHAVMLYPQSAEKRVAVARSPPSEADGICRMSTYLDGISKYSGRGIKFIEMPKCPDVVVSPDVACSMADIRYAIDPPDDGGPLVIRFTGDMWQGDKGMTETLINHEDYMLLNTAWLDKAQPLGNVKIRYYLETEPVLTSGIVCDCTEARDYPKDGWWVSNRITV